MPRFHKLSPEMERWSAMLAEELVQHARPRLIAPGDLAFALGCSASAVLARMAVLHQDEDYRTAAVISPDADYLYRDSGLEGDEVSREIVRAAAAHLREGGFATILCNWICRSEGETWQPLEPWVEEALRLDRTLRNVVGTRGGRPVGKSLPTVTRDLDVVIDEVVPQHLLRVGDIPFVEDALVELAARGHVLFGCRHASSLPWPDGPTSTVRQGTRTRNAGVRRTSALTLRAVIAGSLLNPQKSNSNAFLEPTSMPCAAQCCTTASISARTPDRFDGEPKSASRFR